MISIVKHLEETLEIVDVSYTKVKSPGIFRLASMSRMKVLNCRGILKSTGIDYLKRSFSNISVNQDYCHFANSDEIFHPKDGMWEIETKQYVFKRALKQALNNSIQESLI